MLNDNQRRERVHGLIVLVLATQAPAASADEHLLNAEDITAQHLDEHAHAIGKVVNVNNVLATYAGVMSDLLDVGASCEHSQLH